MLSLIFFFSYNDTQIEQVSNISDLFSIFQREDNGLDGFALSTVVCNLMRKISHL